MKINGPPLSEIPKGLDDLPHIEPVTNIASSQIQREFYSNPTFAKRHREWAHLAKLSYRTRFDCQWYLWSKARLTMEPNSVATESLDPILKVLQFHSWTSEYFLELGSLDEHKLAGFGFVLKDKCVVVFRGTKMTSLHNWCLNLQFVQAGDPPRHKGFQLGWESMKNPLINWLRSHSITEITLVGHSLGGAMAVLAGFDLANCSDWIINEVVTFGCPQVGSERFASHYGMTMRSLEQEGVSLSDCTFNYVLTTDLVPRVLSWHWYYQHVGQHMLIDSKGNAVRGIVPTLERILFPNRVLKESTGSSSFSAPHIISEGGVSYKPISSVMLEINRSGSQQEQDSAKQIAVNYWYMFLIALPVQTVLVFLCFIIALLGIDVRRHEMDRYITSLTRRLTTLGESYGNLSKSF